MFTIARAEKFIERQLISASQFLQINNNQLPRIKVPPDEMLWLRPILNRECNNDNTPQLFPSEFVRNVPA